MTVYQNMSIVGNSTNLYQLTSSLNDVSAGFLGIAILLVMWTVLFVSTKAWSNKDSLASATFITALIGVLFFNAGLIGSTVLLFCVVATAVSGGMVLYNR